MSFIKYIQQTIHTLSDAERRVGEQVLEDPESATRTSTALLARQAGVSDPTVNRFCRSLGCKGFPDFKLQLAQALVQSPGMFSQSVGQDDSPSQLISKIVDANISALEHVQRQTNPALIGQAADMLANARRIEFYGMGATAIVAHDAHYRFFRLGIPCASYEDNLKQRMSAASLGEGDVVLMFSFTGRTIPMIEVAETATAAGAQVIAITSSHSALAKACDLLIPLNNEQEDTVLYTPMSSRIIALTMVDILATAVALRGGEAMENRLKHVKSSIVSTKVGR